MVWSDDDTVTLGEDGVGLLAFIRLEFECVVHHRQRIVQRVFDKPRALVALLLKHDAEVVAEVVFRESKAQHLFALVKTAHHTSDGVNLGLVPEAHIGLVAVDGAGSTFVVGIETVKHEGMSRFLHRQSLRALSNLELEVTVVVGDDEVAALVHNLLAVHLE